ncbi:MAG: fatty acid--CoA ligase family protein [Thermoanaerobaculum sp.]|nr:fatty acid--CoA ligase family protein [Thermoanaerobaculum sp.]
MSARPCPLAARFFRLAEKDPAAPAFLDADGHLLAPRGLLAQQALALVELYRRLPLTPRPIVLSLANGPALVAHFLALRQLGVPVVMADATAPAPELVRVATTVGAVGVVANLERLDQVSQFLPPGVGLQRLTTEPVPISPAAAVLKLSSGSTGEPQAFATSAHQLYADSCHIFASMGLRRTDRTLAAIPLTHSYGLGSCLVPHLAWGTPLVLPSCNLPAALAHTLAAAAVEHFPAVPAMIRALASLPHLPSWPSLRVCLTAGAPLSPKDAHAFYQVTGHKPHVFYGSSECGGITYDRSETCPHQEGAVGTPLRGVRVEVVDEEGKVLPTGVEGRVRVRSRSVVLHAVPPLPEPQLLQPGCFLTGDAGFFDKSGVLHLSGRLSDVVNVAGKKVHPEEVRRVLERLPGVLSAAVVGIPDPHRGQVLGAVLAVAPQAGVTVHKVIAYCRAHLAPYKVPRKVALVPELPLSARGKVAKTELLALLTGKEAQRER